MLEERGKFWNVRDFDDEVGESLLSVFKNLLKYFKIFKYMTYITSSLVLLTPLLLRDQTLPFATWYPEEYIYVFWGIYGLQCVMLAAIATEVLGFDCLFAALCWELTVQFKLLNHRLCNLTVITNARSNKNCADDSKAYIDHHNFLLRQEYILLKWASKQFSFFLCFFFLGIRQIYSHFPNCTFSAST